MKAWTSDFSATPIPLMCCRLYGEVCWGCPGEVIYVGASFARTSRARAPRTAPFFGWVDPSALREVVSLVVTPVVREVGFRCYAFLETLSTCLCNVVHEYSARATSSSNPK